MKAKIETSTIGTLTSEAGFRLRVALHLLEGAAVDDEPYDGYRSVIAREIVQDVVDGLSELASAEMDKDFAREQEARLAAPLTDKRLRALRDQAAHAGDQLQVGVCDLALRGDAQARGMCARVIADAEAEDIAGEGVKKSRT